MKIKNLSSLINKDHSNMHYTYFIFFIYVLIFFFNRFDLHTISNNSDVIFDKIEGFEY